MDTTMDTTESQLRERVSELEQRIQLMEARQTELEMVRARLIRLERAAAESPVSAQGEEAAERMRAGLDATRLDLIRILDLPSRKQKEREDLACRILAWASANDYVSVIKYVAKMSFAEDPVGGGGAAGAQADTPPTDDPPPPQSLWDLDAAANAAGDPSAPQKQGPAPAGAAAGQGSGSKASKQWALHNAAAQGDVDAVASLLGSGSDLAACDQEGRTPLHRAAAGGHAEAVNALLLAGADVNARDKCLRTPLHVVAGVGATDAAELLIRAGADPNARDKSERTPLHRAAGGSHVDMVKMLLEVGAKPDLKDRSDALAVSLSNHPDIRNLLENYKPTLPAERK